MPAIFLVGFMGAGKSSVGRALGKRLKCEFEDLDDRIERRQDRSIAEIFRTSGEMEFRRMEQEALLELLQELPGGGTRIVGLGGGAFVQEENAAVLEAAGVLTVFLDAPAEDLWRRCVSQAEKQDLIRPLLQSAEQFRQLWERRRPHYLKAGLRIETRGRTVAAVAQEIAAAIKPNRAQRAKEGLVP